MRFAAQYVFTGREFVKNGFVETEAGGRIAAVGSLGEMPVETAGTEFHNGIILPGFVNAHCHLELSVVRGQIPPGTGMTEFCRAMKSRPAPPSNREIDAMYEADAEMEREGIVAAGDVANGAASLRVKRESRLRYRTFVETLGLLPEAAGISFARAQETERAFLSAGLPASITPHAPYSLSEPLFRLSMEAGNAAGIVSIHNSESRDEMELFASKRGAMREFLGSGAEQFASAYSDPVQRILRYLAPDVRLLSVHNCCLAKPDALTTACGNTTFVLCPASNIYIGNRPPDIAPLIGHRAEREAAIAIGTDSAASNTRLSVLEELKILSARNPRAELRRLLAAATIAGAQALNLSSELGDFSPGKQPGILLLSNVDFKNMRLTENSVIRKL
jgi:cytosine/adenosine deaminase-related metal-dependent hydrolase